MAGFGMGFVFNGKHSNDFFVVNGIERSVLPPLQNKYITIPNRAGAYDFGTEVGMRSFKVTCSILENTLSGLEDQIRNIVDWLFTEDEAELIFDTDPLKSYWAKLDGATDLDTLGTAGFFSFTFVCSDPFAYSPEKITTKLASEDYRKTFTLGGNVDTYPVIRATIKKPINFFAVTATGKRHVFLGRDTSIEDTAVPKEERVFNDGMSSLSQWTAASIQPDGGNVGGGTLRSNGYSVSTLSWGTGTTWHGGAMQRSLPEPIQDFKIEASVGFGATAQGQIGRIEIYLLDVNNKVLGKMALRDSGGYEITSVEMMVAQQGINRKYLMNYQGTVNTKTTRTPTKKGYVNTTTKTSTYSDFTGILRMQRVGKRFTFYVASTDNKGKHYETKTVTFDDKAGIYKDKLASVVMHIGAYNNLPTMPTAWISHINVWKMNSVTKTQVPIIAEADDVIEIDCAKAAVFLNGEPFFKELDPSSQFFSLSRGINVLAFAPSSAADIEIITRNRWL